MKITVDAVVVFPIYVRQGITLPDDIEEGSDEFKEALREAILEQADLYLEQGSSSPIIQECLSHPEIQD